MNPPCTPRAPPRAHPHPPQALNVFFYLTYDDAIDLDALKDMSANDLAGLTAQINNFGQMPVQILLHPHAPRRPRPPPAAPCAPVTMRPCAPLLRLQLEAVPLALLPLDEALLVFDAQVTAATLPG